MNHFHNTIQLAGAPLATAERAAMTQEDKILAFFQRKPGAFYTPFQVQALAPEMRDVPITSVRRAITNLTRSGRLRKSERTQQELYGMPNHTWYYPVKVGQLVMNL